MAIKIHGTLLYLHLLNILSMKYLITLAFVFLMACNSNSGDNSGYTEDNLPDPEKVQPPADAIPEDMKIVNDSVVKPDSSKVNSIIDSGGTDTMHH